jgi:hypothetical protein
LVLTYTGWNLRTAGYAENALCGGNGTWLPFAHTRKERLQNGDQRLSLEERYGNDPALYLEQLEAATMHLVDQRFLLPEDAKRLLRTQQ